MTLKEKLDNVKTIYSLMYSPTRVEWIDLKDQIIEIESDKLKFTRDEQGFFYVWGWPGPDSNYYDLSTYGKGWALTKQEIIEAWGE